jgi:hypothetical protein
VALVEFAHFDELNVKCVNLKFENLKRLQFKSLASSFLPTNLSFANLLLTFKYETTDSSVSIRNLKGFLLKRNTNFVFNMEIYYHLELNDLEFDFYFNETQIVTKETCLMEKFKFVNFLDTTYSLMMGKGTLYKRPVCPYIFLRSQIKQVIFNQLANSLIFKNALSFVRLDDNESLNLNFSSFSWLSIGVAYLHIDETCSINTCSEIWCNST